MATTNATSTAQSRTIVSTSGASPAKPWEKAGAAARATGTWDLVIERDAIGLQANLVCVCV